MPPTYRALQSIERKVGKECKQTHWYCIPIYNIFNMRDDIGTDNDLEYSILLASLVAQCSNSIVVS